VNPGKHGLVDFVYPSTDSYKVAMVNAAELDDELMTRVVNYVEKNMRIGVREIPPLKPAGTADLDEEADALKGYMPSRAYSMLALVKMNGDEKRHGLLHPFDQIAVLNTTALWPEDNNEETFAKRLEKESIRCIALLAGLPPCVSPRCALWHYTDDMGLDRKGSNLCPPCYLKYQALDQAVPGETATE
jgi:hypothetical protein